MNPNEKNISAIIEGCKNSKRKSQEELYRMFYSYGLTVCLHYSKNRLEAEDILSEGFYKVFKKLEAFDTNQNFKAWFRRVLVNTAIDYARKYEKIKVTDDTLHVYEESTELTGLDQLQYNDLLALLQNLPDQYRIVFNLYVMEGYSHKEIGEQLGIGVSTSKSNLTRAKAKLKQALEQRPKTKTKKA